MSTQCKSARRLMEEAIAQRSRCFLNLPAPAMASKDIACCILEYSSRGLILESLDKVATNPQWLGQPVIGFFCLTHRQEKAEETFYTFKSRICGAQPKPGGLARLGLAEPEAVVFGQRRKSLRVEPESGCIREVVVWRYDRRDGFQIDSPLLKTADFQAGLVRLVNLSAGGLALVLRAPLVKERRLEFENGQRFILHLQLDEPRLPGEHISWLVAKASHTVLDRISSNLGVGMEFLANGCLDAKLGKIRWQPVEDHVIPGLADIFYLWHLDRHRERLG
jgi:hypothetical protein